MAKTAKKSASFLDFLNEQNIDHIVLGIEHFAKSFLEVKEVAEKDLKDLQGDWNEFKDANKGIHAK